MRAPTVIAAASLALAAACGVGQQSTDTKAKPAPAPTVPPCTIAKLGIVGGTQMSDEALAKIAVVGIVDQGGGLCSGVYVGNGWVLTAAHCVAFGPVKAFIGPRTEPKGEWNIVESIAYADYADRPGELNGAPVTISKLDNDIALMRLSEVPSMLTPATLADSKTKVIPSDELVVAGYGHEVEVDTGASGRPLEATVVLQDKIEMLRIGNTVFDNLLRADPTGAPASGRGICSGDLGGPLFVRRSGLSLVVGVTSGFEPALNPGVNVNAGIICRSSEGLFTGTVKHKQWIESLAGLVEAPPLTWTSTTTATVTSSTTTTASGTSTGTAAATSPAGC